MTPFLAWNRLAWKAGEMAMSSAQVITHRAARMAFAGAVPSARDQSEFALMGREKSQAAMESALAMGNPLLLLNQQLAALAFKQVLAAWSTMTSIASSRTSCQSVERQAKFVRDTIGDSVVAVSKISSSSARVARSALKPVHRRVKGNLVRLNRKAK